MHVTTHELADGIVERAFTIDGIRGMLWTPETAGPHAPTPLVLLGQPGGPASLEAAYARLHPRAVDAARRGLASATIELPGSGDRPSPDGVAAARAELRAAVDAGRPVDEAIIARLVLPLVDQAVPEWQGTLDALLELPELTGPVGISGGVISIAIRLAAVDSRIAAAVLFAGSYVPRTIVADARILTIPVHVLLQWDDEGNDRQMALDLFDALGSTEKTLTANMGGHTGVPQHAGEAAGRFLVRHLLRPSP